ncbi:MAG: hypothetical protein V4563_09945 [Pseudomonadota bacterium]
MALGCHSLRLLIGMIAAAHHRPAGGVLEANFSGGGAKAGDLGPLETEKN